MNVALLTLLLLSLAPTQVAAESASTAVDGGQEDSPKLQPLIIVGVLETVGLSPEVDHYGVYATVGFGLSIPLSRDWMLMPTVGLEFSPEFGNWGGTLFLVLDGYLGKVGDVVLTIEPQIGLIHDAIPAGDSTFEHAFYLAAGAGVGLVTNHGTLIPQVVASYGLDDGSFGLVPGVLFSVPF